MAINKKEKLFLIIFKEKNYDKTSLRSFIDNQNAYEMPDNKYLHWSHFFDNSFTLATYENPYWNVNNLTNAIQKYFEEDEYTSIEFVIFDISNSDKQGYVDEKFWKYLKKTYDLTAHNKMDIRRKKLKKIITLQKISDEKKKEELRLKELKEEKAKLEKLKKEFSLKIKLLDKKILEKEPTKIEVVEEKPKKKKFKLF